MNKQNFKKLISHLKKQQKSIEAARFNMRFFGVRIDGIMAEEKKNEILEMPVCNTQACLAGEATLSLKMGYITKIGGISLYSKLRKKGLTIEDAAIKFLGLTVPESERLFYFRTMGVPGSLRTYGWPEQFEHRYHQATTPADRLQVAIDRVEHFIKTNGEE